MVGRCFFQVGSNEDELLGMVTLMRMRAPQKRLPVKSGAATAD